MSMNLKRPVLDIAYTEQLAFIQKLRNDKELSVDDIEIILTKTLLDIKIEKETAMASEIINLTYQVQQLEQEKKKFMQEQVMQIEKEEPNG